MSLKISTPIFKNFHQRFMLAKSQQTSRKVCDVHGTIFQSVTQQTPMI